MTVQKEKVHDLCIGIDLGTTNSVIAMINVKPNQEIVSKVIDISRPVDIFNNSSNEVGLSTQKKPTLPSCVYYREERNYEPLVGDFARTQYSLRPHLVAKSIKSQMGKPYAEGLSPDIPDKTPAQVSAHILRHLIRNVEKICHTTIEDAVITVPANFDSVMCKATLDAAELAGIKVRNEDGSERPILLPEPNAVIYDLINQMQKGEIANSLLDLKTKKNVLVFDMGGGTLDITMHEIRRKEDAFGTLMVNEIASNRYTLLGGDDFDESIAKEMLKRYSNQYKTYPDAVAQIKKAEKTVVPQLRNFAEQLKLNLSEYCSNEYYSGWDEEEEDGDRFPIGGNMGGTGYAYDDTFTKEEIEEILLPYMGIDLKYEDYKKIETITTTRNIIYPILDVLDKASKKMQTEPIVNAVVVNGGMSKFYMITDRLKEFFGFAPIEVLDPDQAVARGAAVFHYYLHKNNHIMDDMRFVGNNMVEKSPVFIEWGENILNDSLYLGLKNGGDHMIIPTGAALPYQSEIMKRFQLTPGQNKIAIPIKTKNIDGSYRRIAYGNIQFRRQYPNGSYLSFTISMSRNKVIKMNAWTSADLEGNKKIEEGSVVLTIGEEQNGVKTKVVAPSGSILKPKDEINNLLQLCKNYEGCSNQEIKGIIAKKIKVSVNSICNAGNKEEFAEEILGALNEIFNNEMKQRLFVIARKIGDNWSEKIKERLAAVCMEQLRPELQDVRITGKRVSVNIQAIYTLGMCASKKQAEQLEVLHEKQKYRHACLTMHAMTKTSCRWLYTTFLSDKKRALKKLANDLQFSVYAIGAVFRNNEKNVEKEINRKKVIKEIEEVICSGLLQQEALICCLIALGWICDQRFNKNKLEPSILNRVYSVINSLEDIYGTAVAKKCEKSRSIALKLINGEDLCEEEEEFLLSKMIE